MQLQNGRNMLKRLNWIWLDSTDWLSDMNSCLIQVKETSLKRPRRYSFYLFKKNYLAGLFVYVQYDVASLNSTKAEVIDFRTEVVHLTKNIVVQ